MSRPKNLVINVITDSRRGVKGFKEVESASDRFERRLGRANRITGATALAIGALGAKARNEASNLQQSSGAVEAVFGRQSKAIKRAAKSAAVDLGLARSDYEQMSAVLGSQLRNLGVSTDKLVPKNKALIKLGGDLAAQFGGSTADAVGALSSLLRGERDPIERYGVSIKQADINAQLAAKGQDKLTGSARKTAETEATLALLTKQTARAQGQRAREAGSDAQAQEVAQAKLKNAFASYGKLILPLTTKIATALGNTAGFIERNQRAVGILAAVLGGLALAVVGINAAYRAYQATLLAVETIKKLSIITTGIQTAAQYAMGTAWLVGRVAALAYAAGIRILNAAMKANPIGLLITAIALVVAGFVLAYKKSSTFRSIVQAVGRAGRTAIGWVVDKVSSLLDWFGKLGPAMNKGKEIAKTAFKVYTTPIRTVIDLVKKLVGWIGKIKFPKVPGAIKKLGGAVGGLLGGPSPKSSPAAMGRSVPAWGRGAAGGPGMSLSAGGSSRGAIVVNITINGAIDKEGTARQLRQILSSSALRNGAVIPA